MGFPVRVWRGDAVFRDLFDVLHHAPLVRLLGLRNHVVWLILFFFATNSSQSLFAERALPAKTANLIQRFCVECHGNDHQEARLNLESLASKPDLAHRFGQWRKVAEMVEQKKMPPDDAEQLNQNQRKALVADVRGELRQVAQRHADDPGPVTLRRLTGAQYSYTVQDLTGLDLGFDRDFVSDAVGGEGFTNIGDVQFVQDSTLERYLAAAKRVADHAVIGTGPLQFYQDPGKTGFELSAITRIQNIYRAHGFRTAAGEGGEAFGLDRYARAFFVVWRFQHRDKLGIGDKSLAWLAAEEKIDGRFAEYIWSVLHKNSLSFPTTDIVERWHALPLPNKNETAARSNCNQIQQALLGRQSQLGENPDAKEEARVLAANSFDVSQVQPFEMNVNWPKGTTTAHVTFSVESADGGDRRNSIVIWRGATIQFRIPDEQLRDPQPLNGFLTKETNRQLTFGAHPRNGKIGVGDFATRGVVNQTIKLPIIAGAISARLLIDAELDVAKSDDQVVRCTISQKEETDQGKSVSALLANPKSESFAKWKDGVLEFARLLPQISHREPAPSDRDPIPPPFDNSYNNPERNFFHARIKYYRNDQFLVDNILDEATRKQLDQAWNDLLGSFEYHNTYLNVVAEKFKIDLDGRGVAELDPKWIARLPTEPRKYVERLHREYFEIQDAIKSARAGHVDNVIQFAELAWRRPLQEPEQTRLRQFYQGLRDESKLDHRQAIRALLTRVLMAPAFLYRAERPSAGALSNAELASRLSYFLWSSTPDDELRRAAAAGELSDPKQLTRQARRMLRDPKARRLATEFFGQWFGFFQFDRYRGVDPQRFPDFTDDLKAAMYDEAVSFFEHIIRDDCPVDEILFAKYGFLNRELAEHYGIADVATSNVQRIENLRDRGGLFGLGAVLTVTSAPRRTSPVKRGDWVLRRVLGTPVPPPPADAGSISADDVLADGKTVRQRLESHRQDASCQNCHVRIDPFGFTLEHFDAIGRWRDRYRDGQAIDDSGTLNDGRRISGPDGLREYLAEHKSMFHRTLCTKLAGYAFGRRESIADVLLIEKMMAELQDEGRFSRLIEQIVTSKQFRFKRMTVEPQQEIDQNHKHE